MSVYNWAKNEIDIACERERGDKDPNEWDYGCACYKSAYKAFQGLMEDGHSGASIVFTKGILNRLIDRKPLTPIEDTPDMWDIISSSSKDYIEYQCKRMPSLFKRIYKNGVTAYNDVDRFICVSKDDACSWHNGFINQLLNKQFPITMPYYPSSKPWLVYCTEGLNDPKNGDFDTIGIWYITKPDGERVVVERFFKEAENTFVEIDRQEYENRMITSKNNSSEKE